MKLNKNLLLIGMTAMLLLPGCSSKDDVVANGEKVALNVSSASISATTRGVYDAGGTLTNGSIGIYSFNNGYSDANVRYDYGTSSWTPNDLTKTIYLGGNAATIFAYAPYTSTFNISATTLNSIKYSEDNDLCTATASGVSSANTSVALKLDHVYSRITLSIDKDAGYTKACNITNISISGPAMYKTAVANLTPSASTLYTSKTAGTVTIDPQISNITSGTPVTASFLMIPAATAEFTDVTTLTFTVDGLTYTATLPVVDPASATGLNALSASSNYVISVKLKPTAISISGVTVNPWNQVAAGTIIPSIQ
jgi:hypothetical protein